MTKEQAIAVLGPLYNPQTGQLQPNGQWVTFTPGDKDACLDGDFTADELEAMAVVMRARE